MKKSLRVSICETGFLTSIQDVLWVQTFRLLKIQNQNKKEKNIFIWTVLLHCVIEMYIPTYLSFSSSCFL